MNKTELPADTAQAELTVHKQLEAYNARDIEAFMQWWADDCQYCEFPTKLLANGAAEIRERHIARFRESNLFGRLIKRTVIANDLNGYAGALCAAPTSPSKMAYVFRQTP